MLPAENPEVGDDHRAFSADPVINGLTDAQ